MDYGSKKIAESFWDRLPQPFFVLAPMEAVTDVVFRHVVGRAGPPDVYFTEFANSTGWVHAGEKAIRGRLLKTTDESPIVAQIWGGEPGDMEALAKHCVELGYDGIDINMGCPAKSAIKSGGSALIRKPEVAIEAIAAAKTAGLPVSVKTRLGYTYVDEWREWIGTLLKQDIDALTIHLRTKKEMSKVSAHYELISKIKALRDSIKPNTKLIINGDIRDRTHGRELVEKHSVDGIMIGRGIFQNPFAFSVEPPQENETKPQLISLLLYHLDLFDQYKTELGRPYETLKRFFKIYIRDFEGAGDLRASLMLTNSTTEARKIIDSHSQNQ